VRSKRTLASGPTRRSGTLQRLRRDVDRHELGSRAPAHELDGLGADAAAGLEDARARRVAGVVMKEVGDRARLIDETGVQSLPAARAPLPRAVRNRSPRRTRTYACVLPVAAGFRVWRAESLS
jgi:hypothetical protein